MARHALTLLLFILVCLFAAKGQTMEIEFNSQISERFYIEDHFIDEEALFDIGLNQQVRQIYNHQDTYNVASLIPEATLTFSDDLKGVLGASFDSVYGYDDTLTTYDSKTDLNAKLFACYLDYSQHGLDVSLGMIPFTFGNGYIHDDAESGISIDIRPYKRLTATFDAALIDDHSYITGFKVKYRTGFLEHLEGFGIYFKENDNLFADAVYQAAYYFSFAQNNNYLIYLPDKSNTDSWYFGWSAEQFIYDAYLTTTFIWQKTQADLEGINNIRFENSAILFNVELSYNLTDYLTAALIFYYESGDDADRSKDSHRFIALSPSNPNAAIFFGNGIDPFLSDKIQFRTITRNGVVAPGIKLTVAPNDKFQANLTAMSFFCQNKPSSQRDLYGIEADLSFSYKFHPKASLSMEADIFKFDNFFDLARLPQPDYAMFMVAGVDIFF